MPRLKPEVGRLFLEELGAPLPLREARNNVGLLEVDAARWVVVSVGVGARVRVCAPQQAPAPLPHPPTHPSHPPPPPPHTRTPALHSLYSWVLHDAQLGFDPGEEEELFGLIAAAWLAVRDRPGGGRGGGGT